MENQTYILAVSGGVDSVAMTHMLAEKRTPNITYVIAHFDHGIRPESYKDAELTAEIAKNLQFQFEIEHGNLGPKASEALARERRYEFLREVAAKYNADKIVTAHHEDDILETIVINLLRGTGPRGLMPMSAPSDIIRPLLNKRKTELYAYVKKHSLQWREDETNEDEDYLRNYVRKNILPKLESHREDFLNIRKRLSDIYVEVDQLIKLATPRMNLLHRTSFVHHSFAVQREIIRAWMIRMGVTDLDRATIERFVMACKTLPLGKKIDVDNALWLVSERENVRIMKK